MLTFSFVAMLCFTALLISSQNLKKVAESHLSCRKKRKTLTVQTTKMITQKVCHETGEELPKC